LTLVDKKSDFVDKKSDFVDKKSDSVDQSLTCLCGKKYNSRQGLWKHKLTCSKVQTLKDQENIKKLNESGIPPDEEDHKFVLPEDPTDKQLIMMLIKENAELKTLMMEVIKNGTQNTTNTNTNTNSHNNNNNKTFNLQFFLNETCKNAMNMSEFIENIKIDLEDVENMGRVGYVQGLSNIIIKSLGETNITDRPIHCTDQKRGTIYIKDNNIWEKDDENNSSFRKTVKHVAHKTFKNGYKFREKYPGCECASSRYSNIYNRLNIELCGGSGDNDVEKEDKIMNNISKRIGIDKEVI